MAQEEKTSICSSKILLLVLHNVLGGLAFGYNLGIIAYAQAELQRKYGNMSDVLLGVISSCIIMGAAVGSISAGWLANKYGRKLSSAIGILTILCAGIIVCFGHNIPFIIAFRTLLGIGCGILTVVSPMYVSELSPNDIRGGLSATFQVFITLGIFIAYIIGYFLEYPRYNNMEYSWRIMFGIGIIPSIFHIILVISIMKESPLWKQKRSLEKSGEVFEEEVTYKYVGWSGLFNCKKFRVLFVGLCLVAALQLTGVNGLVLYMRTIFEKGGLTSLSPLLTIIVGGINFVSTFFTFFGADRIGRKPLLILGLIVMAISLLLIAISFLVLDGKVLGWVSFGSISLFHVGFEISPGSLFWVIVNEMYSPGVKEQASSLMTTLNWATCLLISFIFPIMVERIINATFFIFFSINLLCIIFLWIFYREGKGKSIIEESVSEESNS